MRKKLIIAFIFGLLMMGIGSGIAFAEISSFRYGGEKYMNGEMAAVELQQTVPEGTQQIVIQVYGYQAGKIRIVEDSSSAENEITVLVTCNEKFIKPTFDEECSWGGEETQKAPEEAVYGLLLEYNDSYDEVSELFKMKDEFLKCVKNRVVYSYRYDDVGEVIIKAQPELARRITVR